MHFYDIDELNGAQLSEPILDYCLQFVERWHASDAAIIATDSGNLIASKQAWQQHQLELTNLRCLLAKQGIELYAEGVAAATTIRTLLHDADARRLQDTRDDHLNFDRTQAQQALEDIVQEGIQLNASDIHLLFLPSHATLSYRVDGRLLRNLRRSREILTAAIAAALNTHSDDFHQVFDERRLSSASISLSVRSQHGVQQVRLRTQKSPTRDGFAVTMRIQRDQQVAKFETLKFPPDIVAALRLTIERPTGLVLVVGPTGHGKTSTLAALHLSVPPDLKVISLEDPIEIIQPHIEQKPVTADHPEFNFSNMIKVALREDPDVISISEIRDQATAQAAYTAALTGHLVFATMHAYDAFGALQRLQDLGVSLAALAQPDVLRGIVAQRLLQHRCDTCSSAMATNCASCEGTAKHGRRLLVEYLPMSDKLRAGMLTGNMIAAREQLEQQGWQGLRQQLKEPLQQAVALA